MSDKEPSNKEKIITYFFNFYANVNHSITTNY